MVPDALRGRVMALYSMMFMGMAPFGALLGGAVADRLGAPITVAIGGVASVAGAFVFGKALPSFRTEARALILAQGVAGGEPAGGMTARLEASSRWRSWNRKNTCRLSSGVARPRRLKLPPRDGLMNTAVNRCASQNQTSSIKAAAQGSGSRWTVLSHSLLVFRQHYRFQFLRVRVRGEQVHAVVESFFKGLQIEIAESSTGTESATALRTASGSSSS